MSEYLTEGMCLCAVIASYFIVLLCAMLTTSPDLIVIFLLMSLGLVSVSGLYLGSGLAGLMWD